jgi:hypothetical protein
MTDYTLQYGDTVITLHGYRWMDRRSYSQVSMSVTDTITQAKVLEFFEEQSGRPVTLAPQAANLGHVSLQDLDTVSQWAKVPGRQIIFSDGETSYTCVFARPAITDDKPMLGQTEEQSDELWQATFHLMEI